MCRLRAHSSLLVVIVGAAMLAAVLAGIVASTTVRTVEPGAPWIAHLDAVDRALAAGNRSAALVAWHDAHAAARAARQWDGLLAVGEAYMRLADGPVSRRAAVAEARELYIAALTRAHHEGSLDGVVRSIEAFVALGDREIARHGLRLAEELARGRDESERERVRELGARLSNPVAWLDEVTTF